MQMENNWKVMKEENGKQHNGQNMLKESGQFPPQRYTKRCRAAYDA